MHNLTKIKLYRIFLKISYIPSLLFIYPISLLKKKNSSHLFFFFDRYAIGGAQRIYLDVLKSVEVEQKQIYFTRLSPDEKLKDSFYNTPNADVKDIHRVCENLVIRLFSVHYYAFYINRHRNAHVFSSNSTFFYDMLPFLKRKVITTELFHNFAYGKNGMEFFGLANHRYLHNRVIYDTLTLSNIHNQYKKYGVPQSYLDKLRFIEPGVFIPEFTGKGFTGPLHVVYAGRGGPQKRIWLLNRIAESVIKSGQSIKFAFAGTMTSELSDFVKQHSTIYGAISSVDEMYSIYHKAHVLILVSAYEGFPMVIKESMACGCVPVVTALEGNKMHLKHGENSLLIDAIDDEDRVVREGIAHLQTLAENREFLRTLSEKAYQYAVDNFGREKFYQQCRELLLKNDA